VPFLALLPAACHNFPSWLNHLHFLGLDISIIGFLNSYGYLAVFLFIGVENLGIPFPGETMLVAASVYAATGCGMQEPFVILACIAGSIVGSSIGFFVGRVGGRGLLRKLHVSDKHLAPAEAYFRRYGSATVFFGRFLAVLRAWAAFLAGLNEMNPVRFSIYNGAGAIIWSTAFGLLGFALGKNLDKLKQVLAEMGTLGTVIILVIIALIVVWWLRRRRSGDPATPVEAAPEQPEERAAL
jgi:membrane protein DedA with SNARE-associated domain